MLLLLILITLSSAQASIYSNNSLFCNGFQASFDIKKVIGEWYVVAIVPEKLFPDKPVTCHRVEFSETDEAGLRWLVNQTREPEQNLTQKIKGTIIRQRYYSERPFDVWSQSTDGVNGCFQQVLSLDTEKNDIHQAISQEAAMQLHVHENKNETDPLLLQMLWGKMISAVVYRKQKGITQDELKPSFELLSKLRGPQRLPRVCDRYLPERLFY